jgi:hypothetical protein
MASDEVHQALYDEADEWLNSGCTVEINVGGAWIEVRRMIRSRDGIVTCRSNVGALWFPLVELRGIREAVREVESGEREALS